MRSRGLDPFDVRVREFFERLRELLPRLKGYEELYLDARAILGLSEVVFHQGEWVKHRSSILYLDPLLIMLKVQALEPKELAEIFLKSWSPVVELEMLSPGGLEEALEYWSELLPLSERAQGLEGGEAELHRFSERDLEKRGFLGGEEFEKLLQEEWEELKRMAGARGAVSYWDFIRAESFERTAERAWVLSFLISYGYAHLEVDPLREEILVYHLEKPERGEGGTKSVPIVVNPEVWRERCGGRGRVAA